MNFNILEQSSTFDTQNAQNQVIIASRSNSSDFGTPSLIQLAANFKNQRTIDVHDGKAFTQIQSPIRKT